MVCLFEDSAQPENDDETEQHDAVNDDRVENHVIDIHQLPYHICTRQDIDMVLATDMALRHARHRYGACHSSWVQKHIVHIFPTACSLPLG